MLGHRATFGFNKCNRSIPYICWRLKVQSGHVTCGVAYIHIYRSFYRKRTAEVLVFVHTKHTRLQHTYSTSAIASNDLLRLRLCSTYNLYDVDALTPSQPPHIIRPHRGVKSLAARSPPPRLQRPQYTGAPGTGREGGRGSANARRYVINIWVVEMGLRFRGQTQDKSTVKQIRRWNTIIERKSCASKRARASCFGAGQTLLNTNKMCVRYTQLRYASVSVEYIAPPPPHIVRQQRRRSPTEIVSPRARGDAAIDCIDMGAMRAPSIACACERRASREHMRLVCTPALNLGTSPTCGRRAAHRCSVFNCDPYRAERRRGGHGHMVVCSGESRPL